MIKQSQEIALEQEQLKEKLNMWKELQEKKSPLIETIKQVPIEKTIDRIAKETIIEERDEQTGKVIEYRKLFVIKI